MIKKFVLSAAMLAATSGAAQASTFDFSYTFTDGQTLTGSLDGTLSGDLVTDISHVTVDFDSHTYSGSLYSGSFDPTTHSYDFNSNAAVVSTVAAENNFIFSDSNDALGNNTTNYFYFVNGATPSGLGTQEVLANNLNTGDIDFDNPASGSWSIKPVPIPAALPLMISGIAMLTIARRRRHSPTSGA